MPKAGKLQGHIRHFSKLSVTKIRNPASEIRHRLDLLLRNPCLAGRPNPKSDIDIVLLKTAMASFLEGLV